ncbi:Copine_I [Hexamita inflata]|uniref:Copine_I n=1 Tax=Hexamita inflata TaxID=28002 RepID=A0ABP1HJV4_9EUKA
MGGLCDNIEAPNKLFFKNYKELEDNLRLSGVETLQTALFIDFSKSNNWTGEKTYGFSLHDKNQQLTPYEAVLKTLAPILKNFDDDDLYPVFRFGCMDTKDRTVVPLLFPQQQDPHFNGMQTVCDAYRQALNFVTLSGPTTLAPAITQGISICKAYQAQGNKQQVILLIITDGDVSDEVRDCQAVCDASNYPISICVIGVGDGPFDKMERFDDLKKGRKFDNFHFTDFTEFMKKAQRMENPELQFAAEIFVEIGAQFKAMTKLGVL